MALGEIVANKHREVAARKVRMPKEQLSRELQPSNRSLASTLARPRTGYIMECKRASPSRGLIREDFDPAAIAQSYTPYCDGISVLTDELYFQGSFDYLRTVRANTNAPVLCKDFVVDSYQVDEARWHGADAILLMCSVLDQQSLEQCLARCRELDMDALVEVHDGAELERALATPARIIGINNRNLKTLEVDLQTTEQLAPEVRDANRLLVCESGVSSHDDVRRLQPLCDAFLVGTAFMQAENLDLAIRELVFGRVKICGLRRAEDALLAWQAGATFGGFIDFEGSPRHLELAKQQQLMRAAPLQWVQVVVDQELDVLAKRVSDNGVQVVQLHGQENPEYVDGLRSRLKSARSCPQIWKARRVGAPLYDDREDIGGADRLLLDSYQAGLAGGTGKTFNWEVVRTHPLRHSLVLSGGLNADNAVAAQALGCWALDLSSGVEDSPGIKDAAKIQTLFEQLRGEGRSREHALG